MVACSYIDLMKDRKKEPITYKIESQPAVLREAAVGTLSPLVTVRDAKSHLSALLDWVAGGREITITSDGEPKARLVPASPDQARKAFPGMGRFLSSQPIHGGPSAEEVIRDDRDGRGW